MTLQPGPLLAGINHPGDLKALSPDQLVQLSGELREYILDVVSVHPGHLGSSLGVVELTVALHYVFNTPYDRLIWDVGHQAYPHKILTGRRDNFHTNRQFKGISGFPKRSESDFDAFGVGHSSTSISAAYGMAVASQLLGENDRHHIAVIGDGAMTGGMAMEGLNNAGVSKANLLVILNDNGIAIDKNVGALKEYLVRITTSRGYNRFKDFIWKALGKASRYGPNTQRLVQQIENAVKGSLLRSSNLFESMNFRYFGPVDGHDLSKMVKILSDIKQIRGPKLLHIITTKGKGFKQAENDQTVFHAPGQFDRKTGDLIKKQADKGRLTYQEVFGQSLVELAEKNNKIVAITPAMPSGSALNEMMEKMPDRVFDVGIAEQHAVTFAAGLAAGGFTPFCVIYSTFLQRAYDQVIHDVALQQLPVVFCIDRAGLVGEDGATHHGAFDLAYMSQIPNMIVAAPMNEGELRQMLFTASTYKKGPFAIRYPRAAGLMEKWDDAFESLEIGKGQPLRKGEKVALLSLGHAGNLAAEAAVQLDQQGLSIGHYDMRFLKPIDSDLLHDAFTNYDHIITIEDGSLSGGLGTAVTHFKNSNNYQNNLQTLGIPDEFIEHGSLAQLYQLCGYDAEGICRAVKRVCSIS